MKAAVVGGGTTGCVAALLLADSGHDVTLYELGHRLGGSLCDLRNQDDFWFSGCQYLSPDAPWFKNLRQRIDCEFLDFKHEYGSWTKWNSKVQFRNDIALPVLDIAPPVLLGEPHQARTLADRFSIYGPVIGQFLSDVAARFGHAPDTLAAGCAVALQLSAVMFQTPFDEMLRIKKQDVKADALFALPRRAFNGHIPELRATLPSNGFDSFFDAVQELLHGASVAIRLGAGVTARPTQAGTSTFAAFIGHEPIPSELTVWCCNPTPLMLAAGLGRIDSPPSRFLRVHAFLDNVAIDHPTYIQCFDPGSSVYRIYFYRAGNKAKACIECVVRKDEPQESIVSYASEVVQHVMPGARLRPIRRQVDTAYYLFTPLDQQVFASFDEIAGPKCFVPGAWSEFGRDAKIARVAGLMSPYLK